VAGGGELHKQSMSPPLRPIAEEVYKPRKPTNEKVIPGASST
jgi:hypothetical protein